MARSFDTFDDFFPYYVGQHSKAATRWMHFAGTNLAGLSLLRGLLRRNWRDVARAPVWVYGFAWFSHFVIEGNRPATFGHPVWSARGDFKMFGMMWQGRDAELGRVAADALAENALD